MDADVASFRDWLVGSRGLAARTADVYASMVDLGRRHGSVVDPIRRARTKGTKIVAHAAVSLWCRYRKDDKMLGLAYKALERNKIEDLPVSKATDEEYEKVRVRVELLEEPYRSAMIVVVDSGLRMAQVFDLTRIQVEEGRTSRVPLTIRDEITTWRPQDSVRLAFDCLVQFGGWERVQDIFGRDYNTAYQQLRVILRQECRDAGIRDIKPGELSRRAGESSRKEMLDVREVSQ